MGVASFRGFAAGKTDQCYYRIRVILRYLQAIRLQAIRDTITSTNILIASIIGHCLPVLYYSYQLAAV